MIDTRYRLEKVNAMNVEASLKICNEHIGVGMYKKQQLLEAAQAENSHYYIVYDGETAAGIFFCSAMSAQKAAQTVTNEILSFCGGDELVGICNSIAIAQPYRKSGLARLLLEHFCLLLRQRQKVGKVFALAWINGQHIPAANILTQCGFDECLYVKQPWYGRDGLKCPVCKKPRCQCDGMLYRKCWGDRHEIS